MTTVTSYVPPAELVPQVNYGDGADKDSKPQKADGIMSYGLKNIDAIRKQERVTHVVIGIEYGK